MNQVHVRSCKRLKMYLALQTRTAASLHGDFNEITTPSKAATLSFIGYMESMAGELTTATIRVELGARPKSAKVLPRSSSVSSRLG